MYKVRDKVYSDAGYILVGENKRGYQFVGDLEDFSEVELSLDDMELRGEYVTYGGITQFVGDDLDYGKQKADMVKRRYSYDDQIAIMLNRDGSEDSELAYARMEAWREWSGRVAHRISEVASEREEE